MSHSSLSECSLSVPVSQSPRNEWREYENLPTLTISAHEETGLTESSIKVPLQRAYIGRSPVIPSSLSDTPCATLGVQGILDTLNTTLQTAQTLDTPFLSSFLEDCIVNDYDFGTVYAHVRPLWPYWSTIQDELRRWKVRDQEDRRNALVDNRIVNVHIPPRRVWDLYSNRVLPKWRITGTGKLPSPISHAWADKGDRVDVWTPINGRDWPVSIPKDANLDLIRIELLNLGAVYVWLDVLCLRQKGGPREDLRIEEWKLDVPTIGYLYRDADVVVWYLSGLGRPLSLKEGDLESDRCWFRRAWTLQEVGNQRIIAGDTPGGPLHAEPIDDKGDYENDILTRFHKQLQVLDDISPDSYEMFSLLAEMQKRVSANPVDKVAGLAFRLESATIPAYYENQSLEDAWVALVNTIIPWCRAELFFLYPEPGTASKRWRPSWEQVMTRPLPTKGECGAWTGREEDTDVDWCEGSCIEKGFVKGLAVGDANGVGRCGQLTVEDELGTTHAFQIIATHQYPIPEQTYVLIGAHMTFEYWALGRRLTDQWFEKVSVFAMSNREDRERLKDLGVVDMSRKYLL
ncbi:hypothetical protein IW261DRAFT_1597175 [Armillaria novae-zelandiae]|uniref:Heterokaryon incompatibility domain-containing protein n=1 Tax=Armillaria novae-zelandiae TaxID=153914 RepID=A0AA39NU21_9AGAR|nr:hypothetical protein IW261DRAFT_1597175 [Armillaria novae-zelandiae]